LSQRILGGECRPHIDETWSTKGLRSSKVYAQISEPNKKLWIIRSNPSFFCLISKLNKTPLSVLDGYPPRLLNPHKAAMSPSLSPMTGHQITLIVMSGPKVERRSDPARGWSDWLDSTSIRFVISLSLVNVTVQRIYSYVPFSSLNNAPRPLYLHKTSRQLCTTRISTSTV